MDRVTDLGILVSKIDEGLEMRRAGIAEAGAYLDSFYYAPNSSIDQEIMAFPPGSHEAYTAQMRLIYEPIAGHRHDVSFEGLDVPPLEFSKPFPFSLSPKEIGYWTMAYGYFTHCLKMRPGGRLLEIGFGPGGLTEILIRSGLQVTALDVRESNCRQFKQRAALLGETVNVICGAVDKLGEQRDFDAIIFYESFHHMPAPATLLMSLLPRLKLQGKFVFGAEPIQPPGPLIPYPWGFRMNGGSLGAIRDVGWVEFGFHQQFFEQMLSDLGFAVQREFLPSFNHCDVWTATRQDP